MWGANTRSRLAARPIIAIAAIAMGLATVLLIAAGAAPADQVGAGVGRFVPAIVAVVGPVIAGLAVVSPWPALLAWLLVMPVTLLARVEASAGPLQLTLSTALVAALAIGLILQRTEPGEHAGDTWTRTERRVWLAAAAIAALALGSAAVSGDVAVGLPIALHGVVEPIVLLGIVVSLRLDAKQLVWLLLAMGTSVGIASIYSILRISRIATTAAEVEAQRTQIAHLTYYNVGIYGDMLVIAVPLLLVGIIGWRQLELRRWLLAALVLALGLELVGLYSTFSKSAWIGCLVAVLALAVGLVHRWRARAAFFVAALVIAALVVPYPIYIMNALRIDTAGNPYVALVSGFQAGRLSSWNPDSSEGEVSIGERLLATEAAARMAIDHPLLGVGPGGFRAAYASPAYHQAAATRNLGSAHNFIANLAAELGLPLVVLVLLGFLVAAAALARVYRSGEPLERLLAVAAGAAGLGFLVVAETFGVDLYRPYRVMNADVLFAALLVAAALALGIAVSARQRAGEAASSVA